MKNTHWLVGNDTEEPITQVRPRGATTSKTGQDVRNVSPLRHTSGVFLKADRELLHALKKK